MELSEFALTVLRSSRVEDKLLDPGVFTDDAPARHAAPVGPPGRPRGAELDADEAPPRFPSPGSLEELDGRGLALHFFANHELMALELMALTLLRFPDVEPGFRLGVARTMLDEQKHFRLYRDRAEELGVGFGEARVSPYFWNALCGIQRPMDYVTVLSLTLEQANLDFARWYSARFNALGDPKTAAIMDEIHEDEVEHVAYGLRWFDRWRDPGVSLWDAWTEALPAGVDPSQARGKGFSVEGRRRAGLPEAFIRRVSSLSRQRVGPGARSAGGDRWQGFAGPPPRYLAPSEGGLADEVCAQEVQAGLSAPKAPEATTEHGGPILRFSLHPRRGGTRRRPAVTRRLAVDTPGLAAWCVGRAWQGLDRDALRRLHHGVPDSPLRLMRRAAAQAAARLRERGSTTLPSLDVAIQVRGGELSWWLEGLRVEPGPGRFAAALRPILASDSEGLWLRLEPEVWGQGGCTSPSELLEALDEELPLRTSGEPGRFKLVSGALPTCDPDRVDVPASILLAGADREELLARIGRLLAP